MGLRDKLKRLEKRAAERRTTAELEAVFMSSMARFGARISGEPLLPPHPRSNDPRYAGTFLDGAQVVVDHEGEPIAGGIEDLSES